MAFQTQPNCTSRNTFSEIEDLQKKKKIHPTGTLSESSTPEQKKNRGSGKQRTGKEEGKRKTEDGRSRAAWTGWNRKVKKAVGDYPRNQSA